MPLQLVPCHGYISMPELPLLSFDYLGTKAMAMPDTERSDGFRVEASQHEGSSSLSTSAADERTSTGSMVLKTIRWSDPTELNDMCTSRIERCTEHSSSLWGKCTGNTEQQGSSSTRCLEKKLRQLQQKIRQAVRMEWAYMNKTCAIGRKRIEWEGQLSRVTNAKEREFLEGRLHDVAQIETRISRKIRRLRRQRYRHNRLYEIHVEELTDPSSPFKDFKLPPLPPLSVTASP